MGLNKDKKKKLAYLMAKQRVAATGASLSTPLTPSTSAAPASHPTNPAPTAVELRGVVVESDDEDTCIGLQATEGGRDCDAFCFCLNWRPDLHRPSSQRLLPPSSCCTRGWGRECPRRSRDGLLPAPPFAAQKGA